MLHVMKRSGGTGGFCGHIMADGIIIKLIRIDALGATPDELLEGVAVWPPTGDRGINKMSTTDEGKVHTSESEPHHVGSEASQQLTHVDELKGKPVISISNGARVGAVDDVAIDPESKRVAALIMSTGTMFQRDVVGIPADHVQVWGKDAILVRDADVLYRGTNWPPERAHWVHALDRFKGTSVISTDGRRLGQVSNILLEPGGILAGFTIGQSSVPNPLNRGGGTQAIFVGAASIKTLGRDVVIVDAELLAAAEQTTEDQNAPAQEATTPPQPSESENHSEPAAPTSTQP